jgi:hypothetical protein
MRHLYVLLLLILLPLHMAWAGSSDCKVRHAQATGYLPGVGQASVQGFESRAPSAPTLAQQIALPAPESLDDDPPLDSVEQISAWEWNNVSVDRLSCKTLPQEPADTPASFDPHEFDLPGLVAVPGTPARESLFAAAQSSLLSAPLSRTYRPPMRAA